QNHRPFQRRVSRRRSRVARWPDGVLQVLQRTVGREGTRPQADHRSIATARARQERLADWAEGLRDRQDARVLGLLAKSALAGSAEGLGQARHRPRSRWVYRELFLSPRLPLRALSEEFSQLSFAAPYSRAIE